MRYLRPNERKPEKVPFPEGNHKAKIVAVKAGESKNHNKMFTLRIEGDLNELAYYHLTFGNYYTEENLGFLLASIEDNGINIPDLDFGFNQPTATFLNHKDVFIKVSSQKKQGKLVCSIDRFLTKNEYSGLEIKNESPFDDMGSFPDQAEDSKEWEGDFD